VPVHVEWVALVRLGRFEERGDALARAVERYGAELVDVRSELSWKDSMDEEAVRRRNARLRLLPPDPDEEDDQS